MPFGNAIVGSGGSLIRSKIKSVIQTATLGWSINTDGTASFTTVNGLTFIGKLLELTGQQAGTQYLYWLFNTPFGNGILLTWDSSTSVWTFSVPLIVGNPQTLNFDDAVGNAIPLKNGGRPIYYSKPGLPDLINSAISVGPTVAAATLVIATSTSITMDGTTRPVVTFSCGRLDTTTAGDVFTCSFRDNGVIVKSIRYLAPGAADSGREFRWTCTAAQTPTAGAHVFDFVIARTAGVGTLSVIAAAASPFQLTTSEFL
jgi:hypothetical protein